MSTLLGIAKQVSYVAVATRTDVIPSTAYIRTVHVYVQYITSKRKHVLHL